jgi:NADPH:quinone reductase-like Zn-dependent oxidoreductase
VKAVCYDRYGGPEVLEFRDVSDPVPGADEVLIRVRAASVAPGDWKVRAGLLQQMFPTKLPKIPGRDGAGVVIARGAAAQFAEIGDELCFVTQHVEQGSAAELIARSREHTVPKPPALSFAEAASLIHAGVCAWIGLVETGGISAGDRVLIHGASGGIGSLAVQIAKASEAEVVATCSAKNADYVRSLGADRVIAYDRGDYARDLRDLDLIFDLAGGDIHERSTSLLRPGGTIVWLYTHGSAEPPVMKGVKSRRAVIHDRRETMVGVMKMAESRRLLPQVGLTLPLARCAEAHRLLEEGRHGRGRIVLTSD